MDRVQSLTRDKLGVESSEQESASAQGSAKAKVAGRPVAYFRANHFKTRDDLPTQHSRVKVECIYCTATMDSRNEKSQDHILEHCKEITPEIRKAAANHVMVTVKPTAGKRPATSLSRTSSKKDKREQQDVGTSCIGR